MIAAIEQEETDLSDEPTRVVRRRHSVKLFSTALWTSKVSPWGVLHEPSDAAKFLAQFIGTKDREYFVAIHLSTRSTVLGLEIVSIGDLNSAIVTPREVFKAAILSNAESIIVGHNHPSGDITPSPEDLAIYRSLKDAGDMLGIKVLDCLIVGLDRWHSVALSSK